MNYVYSTLTCSTNYAIYQKSGNSSTPVIIKKILIKGGHLAATSTGRTGLYTPYGIVTEVSDEDLELLLNDYHFKQHLDNNFVRVEKRKHDPEKVAKDLTQKDASSQITPGDLGTLKAKLYDKDTMQ